MEIYRSYTDDELAAEVAKLKKEDSVFVSQQSGSKSFTRDLQALAGKLSAAIRVQNERKVPGNDRVGVTDFR